MRKLVDVEKTMLTKKFARDVKRYQHLIENLHKVDVSKDEVFQRIYNGFFQLRRNDAYRAKHYEFLERNKANDTIEFKEILVFLSSIQNSVEASFATKMLSIIRPKAPVWDSKVLDKLNLKKPKINSPRRIEETFEVYERICAWYEDFFARAQFKEWIELFDKHYPNSGIDSVKKVDFVLWQMD